MKTKKTRIRPIHIPETLIRYRDLVFLVCLVEFFAIVAMFTSIKPSVVPSDIVFMFLPAPHIIISVLIGLYFLYRIFIGTAKKTSMALGLSYFFYAFFMTWFILYAKYSWSQHKAIVFAFFQGLIIFLALNFYGVVRGFLKRHKDSVILVFVIIVCGDIMLAVSLIISGIFVALCVLNFLLLLPLSSVYIYVFWIIGKQTRFISPRVLLVSWLLFALFNLAWSITGDINIIIIFLELQILPLVLMLVGYVALGLEIKINTLMEEIEMLRS